MDALSAEQAERASLHVIRTDFGRTAERMRKRDGTGRDGTGTSHERVLTYSGSDASVSCKAARLSSNFSYHHSIEN